MSFRAPLAFGAYFRRVSLHYNSFQGNIGGGIEFVRQLSGRKATQKFDELRVEHSVTSADVPPSLEVEWKDGSKTDLNPENMKLTDVVDRLRNDLGRYRLGEWREELSKPLESVGE